MSGLIRTAAAGLLTTLSTALEAAGPTRYPVPPEAMHPEKGHCYIASMDLGEEGDKFTANQSGLLLFEDGNPLCPARSAHRDIRERGQGRYSHWTRTTLYFSASDNSDPRRNGRKYEVASTNAASTLGGLSRFPVSRNNHVEVITANPHEYSIEVGGTLDSDNTRTLASDNCTISFQNNVALTIENIGDSSIVNPRLVLNDRGNWHTFESLLEEFTRGARTDQDKVYLIWENMRRNTYHERPLFGDATPHDPVRLFNFFGFNLCDDAGHAGCSLFHYAGLTGSKNRALHGHVQCEARVDGKLQFMDIDMDAFYLDRENERPVSGDGCARDHDLVRRELNYGPVVPKFIPSEGPAALFGPDDELRDARHRGYEIAYALRPGESAIFRWDNVGKLCAENRERLHLPEDFGNSKFLFRPRLDPDSIQSDADFCRGIGPPSAPKEGGRVAGQTAQAELTYRMHAPYPACGGETRAAFFGLSKRDDFSIALSLDGKTWKTLWERKGTGPHVAKVALDEALDVHRKPPKYEYFIRIGLSSADQQRGANLCSLEIETVVMAAPVSLPRLLVGMNTARYRDAGGGDRRVRITHEWEETDAIQPLPPIGQPAHPKPGSEVHESIVRFSWPGMDGADRYHFQVSRRRDFAWPYRPGLDVIIPEPEWQVPFTGIFSPDTTYFWRVRCRDHWGAWGAWSEPWTFTWQGPRVPVNVRLEQQGTGFVLRWEPNPGGARPEKFEVYGSDEKGFSVARGPHESYGRGKVPGNLLGETTRTSMLVIAPGSDKPAMNKVYYRVVAIDAGGTESGCSDYAEAPHPFIYSPPVTQATVNRPYRYQAASLRSLNDLQHRYEEPCKKFWDIEENRFTLVQGPAWLGLDETTGVLTGIPPENAPGTAKVRIRVANQFGGQAEQAYDLVIGR